MSQGYTVNALTLLPPFTGLQGPVTRLKDTGNYGWSRASAYAATALAA